MGSGCGGWLALGYWRIRVHLLPGEGAVPALVAGSGEGFGPRGGNGAIQRVRWRTAVAEVASGKYCRASSCLFMALELFFCKCLNINFSGGYGGILYNLYK